MTIYEGVPFDPVEGCPARRFPHDHILCGVARRGGETGPTRERMEALGVILAIVDSARTMRPPLGTSAESALETFATMAEISAITQYGTDWNRFVAYVRLNTKGGQ